MTLKLAGRPIDEESVQEILDQFWPMLEVYDGLNDWTRSEGSTAMFKTWSEIPSGLKGMMRVRKSLGILDKGELEVLRILEEGSNET